MSRCFPFPPPGYILEGIRDEGVIKSIKGAEKEAKKEQRTKDRKREKKEKKRKEREGKEGESEKKRSSHKRRRKEVAKDGQNQKVDAFHKLKESEIESLEKSSLTIERDLLQTTSQNSCDSTLNSNELPKQQKEKQPLDGRHKQALSSNELPKQQKEKQPLDGRHNNDSESIIRIRLPISRQKDPEVIVMTNKDQRKPYPSRGIKLDSTREQPVNQRHCSTSAPEHASKPSKETSKDTKLCKEKISSFSTGLCSLCPPALAVEFLNVVENWVPNTIERTNSEDEECWWFSKKPSNHKFDTDRCKQINKEIKQVSSSMACPCARLLPEADVYSLPYTVPF